MAKKLVIREEDVRDYLKSLTAVADSVKHISEKDAFEVGDEATAFIREKFPKAKGSRATFFDKGAHRPKVRGRELWRGWRTYPTSRQSSVGFVLQHARMNDLRIRTILASLDQGSKAHTIILRHGQAFRFLGQNAIAIRAGSLGTPKKIRIPRRAPQPGPDGYIKPTQKFIETAINELAEQRARDIEDVYARKRSRLDRLRLSYARVAAKRITDNE